jgi:hypothetical protein
MAGTEAAIGRELRRLFDGGSVAGLTEAQLLDRVARRDESAGAAFEAILVRHKPAVLACSRRVLGGAAAASRCRRSPPPLASAGGVPSDTWPRSHSRPGLFGWVRLIITAAGTGRLNRPTVQFDREGGTC